MAELLKWIYAERFDPAPDTSQALLVLADEYRLPLLAQMCETLIQEGNVLRLVKSDEFESEH